MKKELEDKWDEAARTGQPVSVNAIVVCDFCNKDFTNSDIRRELDDVLKRVYERGYRHGWKDAVARISSTASQISDASSYIESSLAKRHEPAPRAPRGTVPKTVRRILKRAGEGGITANNIVVLAHEGGHFIAPSSVRGFLRRLENEGRARRECDVWYSVKISVKV